MMTVCSVVLLYLASVLPAARLGIVAVSSLFGIAAIIEAGLAADIFVFIGSSLIGWLIVPDKPAILIYTLFLGYYPIVFILLSCFHTQTSKAGDGSLFYCGKRRFYLIRYRSDKAYQLLYRQDIEKYQKKR